MLKEVAASTHNLAAQDADVVDVPLQFPSVPTKEAQVAVVPEYDEHVLNILIQP